MSLGIANDFKAGAHELVASIEDLQQVEPERWSCRRHFEFGGPVADGGHARLDGGELLAHAIWIAEAAEPSRHCLGINALFPREGRLDEPVEHEHHVLHAGRTLAFSTIISRQAERGVVGHCQAVTVADLDGLSHQPLGVPAVDWEGARPDDDMLHMFDPTCAVVGEQGLGDQGTGDARVDVVMPFPERLPDGTWRRAYVAYATDHLMMAPALRPFEGVGYRTKNAYFTAVVGHSVRFWTSALDATELRFTITSPTVARGVGMTVGHGFDPSGKLLVTCTQDLFVRAVTS
jgi:acyl-CoA thioesterase II